MNQLEILKSLGLSGTVLRDTWFALQRSEFRLAPASLVSEAKIQGFKH